MVEGEESRCVLCNQVVAEGCAVSAQCRSSMSHTEILLVLQAILSPPSYPPPPFSTRLCTRCFNLLDTIDTLQVQLKLKKSEVLNLSANCRNDIVNTAEIEHKVLVTEVTEPPKKKDKGLLTSEDLKCQVCDKSFEKRRYLMDHLRRVHNSAVHQCKGCSVRFKLKEELSSHQQQCESFLSTKTQPAVSGGISVTSGPRGGEEEEKVLTKRKKNNKCKECDRYFLTQALLKSHIKILHQGGQLDETEFALLDETKIEKPVICNVCEITVNNQYALSIHQGSVHGFERPWGCQLCGKNFARHLELVNHRRVHSGDKPFQCDICGSRFNQKQNLQTHVRHIHLGERRYECSICKMKFRRKRLLDCHINSKHKFERPYQCRQCSATFVYPEHVRKHEATHREDRRVKCGDCGKTFKSKTSLDNHLATHRPADTFQCLSCPQYFLAKADLLQHLKLTNHPKGVHSASSQDVVIQQENKQKVGVNMSIIETVNVYDDVVLLLAGEDEVHSVVHHQDEVQTAISSIVEIEHNPT